MILNIRVISQGKNLHEFASEVNNFFHFEFQDQLFEMGQEAHQYMLSTIEANRKRLGGTGNLTKSIQFQYWAHGYSCGFWIGDIDYLNKNAKYWYWCLAEDTEIYVLKNDRIISTTLQEIFNDKEIKYILTPYGLKKIINIKEAFPNNKYKIILANYKTIEASGKHRFLCKLNKNILEKRVENFPKSTLDWGSYSFLFSSLNSVNRENLITEIKINDIDVKLDYEYGYLIGFILGDGHIGKDKRVSIAQKDYKFIWNKTQKFCKKYNYLPRLYKSDNIAHIYINNKLLYNIFNYFVEGTKENKKINNFFLNSSKEFRQGILDGYKDSDGRKNRTSGDQIRTISEELMEQLLLIASSLGYDLTYENSYISDTSFGRSLMYNGSYYFKGRNFWQSFWKECKEIHLDKKRNSLGKFIHNSYKILPFKFIGKKLNSIQKKDIKKRFYDIAVEDQLFLINGGIVSHNCNYGIAQSGRRIPPANRGFFAGGLGLSGEQGRPIAGAEGEQWVHTGDKGDYLLKPKKPIEAVNYIENSVHLLINRLMILETGLNRMIAG